MARRSGVRSRSSGGGIDVSRRRAIGCQSLALIETSKQVLLPSHGTSSRRDGWLENTKLDVV